MKTDQQFFEERVAAGMSNNEDDNFEVQKLEAQLMHQAEVIKKLQVENWQLRGALGQPVPGEIPEGNFRCGLCEAKTQELLELRAKLEFAEGILLGMRRYT